MKVRYTPILGDEPETIEAFGTTLTKGEWVDVHDDHALKVASNPYFEARSAPDEVDGEPVKMRSRRAKLDDAAEQRAQLQSQAVEDARAAEAEAAAGESA